MKHLNCKWIDELAIVLTCVFVIGLMVQVYQQNVRHDEISSAYQLQIEGMKSELKEVNKIAASRLERLDKMSDSIQLLETTISEKWECQKIGGKK